MLAGSLSHQPSTAWGPSTAGWPFIAFPQPITYRPHQRIMTLPQAPPSVRRSVRRRGGRELSLAKSDLNFVALLLWAAFLTENVET